MINYIIIFILTLPLIFLDHLFFTTSGILISPLIFVLLFDVISFDSFFVLVLISTLGLDVTFHYSLGLSLVCSVIALCIFKMFSIFVHAQSSIIKLIPVLLFNVSLYFLIEILPLFRSGFALPSISWNIVWSILFKSIIATMIYLLLSFIVVYLRSDKSNSVKLR